ADYQYIYAVATDKTVRVAEVNVKRKECDTQVDPRFLRNGFDAVALACIEAGAAETPPRRAGARGPGIDLGRDEIPLSVDFVRSDSGLGDPLTPGRLIGHFALISSSTGTTFVANVDDDDYYDEFLSSRPLAQPVTLVMPHQVRDAIPDRADDAIVRVSMKPDELRCEDNGKVSPEVIGGPRSPTNPARNIPTGFIAPEKATQLPGIRQLLCTGADSTRTISELAFANPEAERDLVFPDLRALATDETWALTYEGSLSIDRVDTAANGPVVRESMLYVDQSGMHLRDQTKPYCSAGVQPNDIVQMRGCDPALGSNDCPIGYSCYVHPQSQVQGIGACLLTSEAERLADACKDFLTSIRRYTVVRAESGELLLTTRRHELRTTPLDGCSSDAQCENLADVALRTTLSRHPSDPIEQMATDARDWVCRADTTRAPRNGNVNRCNLSCDVTADCTNGTVCVGGDTSAPGKNGLCMEGVVPPQACVNAPQRYELRASEAFVVAGSRSGYVHAVEADANSRCVKPTTAHPLLDSRIPLDPPACNPNADPVTGRLPAPNASQYDANPCKTTVMHAETVPRYIPGTCSLAESPSEIRERAAPAIRYRSRGFTLTLVDPYYPGDQT
ncbi:MAG TPA: hypothetical protein VK427_20490, partial [Kofleriaceae bacterium]|nr:hypothetical protein [Kofleriaceae bacterium]